jgi:hypothetical protein
MISVIKAAITGWEFQKRSGLSFSRWTVAEIRGWPGGASAGEHLESELEHAAGRAEFALKKYRRRISGRLIRGITDPTRRG